jgi:TRAP-type C4-dicarboxylate transport system permease small subunit
MARFKRILLSMTRALNWVACALIAAMMFLTSSDVIGRYLGYPVRGTYDITGLLAVLIICFSIADTQIKRGHVRVEFLVLMLSRRTRALIESFTNFLSLGFFILVIWQTYEFGSYCLQSGKVSLTEHIPLFPFVYAISLSCIPACLILLMDLVNSLTQAVGR